MPKATIILVGASKATEEALKMFLSDKNKATTGVIKNDFDELVKVAIEDGASKHYFTCDAAFFNETFSKLHNIRTETIDNNGNGFANLINFILALHYKSELGIQLYFAV